MHALCGRLESPGFQWPEGHAPEALSRLCGIIRLISRAVKTEVAPKIAGLNDSPSQLPLDQSFEDGLDRRQKGLSVAKDLAIAHIPCAV